MTLSRFLLPLAAFAMLGGQVLAQTAAPPATAAKPASPVTTSAAKPASPATQPTTMTAEAKAAKSKACSAEADKQGLHGKARKTFRSDCKRR